MIKCTVKQDNETGNLYIDFADGSRGLILESSSHIAEFAVLCGLVKAPENWDKSCMSLPRGWDIDIDFNEITECPEECKHILDDEELTIPDELLETKKDKQNNYEATINCIGLGKTEDEAIENLLLNMHTVSQQIEFKSEDCLSLRIKEI